MFVLPGLLALLVAYYTDLHEKLVVLRSLPVMLGLFVAASFGLLLDIRLGLARAKASP